MRFALRLLLLTTPACSLTVPVCVSVQGRVQAQVVSPLQVLTAIQTDDYSAPDNAAEQINNRLMAALRQQPRMGVVFDRVYRFHLERNTLDDLISTLQKQVDAAPDDSQTWMLLGLFNLRRHQNAEAVLAFQNRQQLRPQDPFAAWYLGQALLRTNEPQAAAQAMEMAIAAGPDKRQLLEIAADLSRLYLRLKQPDRAMQLWTTIEVRFPQDLRVREQIANALISAGQFDAAQERFLTLAGLTQDPWQRLQFMLQVAEMHLRENRQQEALLILEIELDQLRPESWLYQEVRARIEDVFLRVNNRSALISYYRNWLRNHPDDLQTTLRLAQSLAAPGNASEAIEIYQQALRRAPSDVQIRKALIAEFVRARNFSAAADQHQLLYQIAPDDLDNLQAWGLLFLRDRSLQPAEQRSRAAAVWQQMLNSFPKSASVAARVGELLRRVGRPNDAIGMYRKAVALAPAELQFRETLGQYLFEQGAQDEAVIEWKQMAADDRRSVATLIRLSEILLRFELNELALHSIHDALTMQPDFLDQLRLAQLFSELEKHDDALQLLQAADAQTESVDEQQRVEELRINILSRSGRLPAEVTTLLNELEAGNQVTADRWQRLASMQRALDHPHAALNSIRKASALEPESVELHTTAAELLEECGDLVEAIGQYETLAALDRPFRTQHLQQIIRIHQQLGNIDQAVQTAQQLLQLEPDQREHYLLIADLCLQSDRKAEALSMVQRASALFPTDHRVLMALADILANNLQTDQAIEIYWQAFDIADTLHLQRSIVEQLAELHLRTNSFENLIQRLDSIGEQPGRQRSMAFCLADAWLVADRSDLARDALKPLLTEDTQDIELLQQLSVLYERDGLSVDAAGYQRRINQINPSPSGSSRLAGLLLRAGSDYERADEWEQACEVYLQALRDDPPRFAANFETHLQSFQYAQRLPELARMVLIVGVERFGPETSQLIHLGAMAARQDADDQPGATLIAAVLDTDRENELPNLILARRLMALGDQEFLDRLIRILSDPPGGFSSDRWAPWSTDAAIQELPLLLNQEDHLQAIHSAVDTQLSRHRDWHGGRLLAGILYAISGQTDESNRRLNALLTDSDVTVPDEVALRAVGFLSKCNGDWHSQQIQLLEACLKIRSLKSSSADDDPVIYRLRNLYLLHGMPEKARTLGRDPASR